VVALDAVAQHDVRRAATDRDARTEEAFHDLRCADALVPDHKVADDEAQLLRCEEFRVLAVGCDAEAVADEHGLGDPHVARRVRAVLGDRVALGVEVTEHGVARPAMPDVGAGVRVP
jgi:hypothetical protein